MPTAQHIKQDVQPELILPHLFGQTQSGVELRGEGLEIVFYRSFFAPDSAAALFEHLLHELVWHQVFYHKYKRELKTPRYTTVFGRDNSFDPRPFKYPVVPIPKSLEPLVKEVELAAHNEFNIVLCNLYLDNSQTISYHSDDEAFLGTNPTIASLSLGAARKFVLRKKDNHTLKRQFLLQSGDLLVMRGRTQHDWEHSIPRSRMSAGPRINITFRKAINRAGTNNYYRYNRFGDDYKILRFSDGAMEEL